MVRRWIAKAILIAAALLVGIGSCCVAAHAEGFDKPVREVVVDLGSSPDQPDFPNLHVHLSCYYYAKFMVKQLDDDGNKGALRISITQLLPGQTPVCTRIHRKGEIVISDGWDYYWGVKEGLVILIGADGSSGGMNFDVFDSKSGMKVFKDYVWGYKEGFNFERDANGQLSLRYQRVSYGDCSLAKDGIVCWEKFKEKAGIKDAPMPNCSGYEDLKPQHQDDPSVISYPVEVNLFPRPTIKMLSSSVKCWAAE
jgi:hypothetical protein